VLMLASVLIGLAAVLNFALTIFQWILIARAVISWVSPDPRNPIVRFLYQVTDPAIRVIRSRLPATLRYFPLDIGFLALFALVIFGLYGIVPMLSDYGAVLRSQALGAQVSWRTP
jgi:YggT family protein